MSSTLLQSQVAAVSLLTALCLTANAIATEVLLAVRVEATQQTSVRLSWKLSHPSSFDVQHYNISCSAILDKGSGRSTLSRTVSNSSSSVTMSGLVPSTGYECCVLAVAMGESDLPVTCVTAATRSAGLTAVLAGVIGGLLGMLLTLVVIIAGAGVVIFVLHIRRAKKRVRCLKTQRKFPSAQILAELTSEQNKPKHCISEHEASDATTRSSDEEPANKEPAPTQECDVKIQTSQCVAYNPVTHKAERKHLQPYEEIADISDTAVTPPIPHAYEDVETRPKAHTYEDVEDKHTLGILNEYSYIKTETHAKPQAGLKEPSQGEIPEHAYDEVVDLVDATSPLEDHTYDDLREKADIHTTTATTRAEKHQDRDKPCIPKKPESLQIQSPHYY